MRIKGLCLLLIFYFSLSSSFAQDEPDLSNDPFEEFPSVEEEPALTEKELLDILDDDPVPPAEEDPSLIEGELLDILDDDPVPPAEEEPALTEDELLDILDDDPVPPAEEEPALTEEELFNILDDDPVPAVEEEAENSGDLDLDALFNEEMIEDVAIEDQEKNPQNELLKDEKGIQWGGDFTGTVGISFDWDNYFAHGPELSDSALTPQIDSSLFFDARPLTDFRVFGKFSIRGGGNFNLNGLGIDPNSISVQPQDDGTFSVTVDDAENDQSNGQPIQLNFGVEELFTDFQWKDHLFFRFGKSFVSWGVGYFWSPADFVNLDRINVEDPTSGRSGPVHFKVHYPFKNNNAYLYVIVNEITKPQYVIFAPKVEFLFGNTEVGAGFYFQYQSAPRMMTTISTSIWKLKIFGEGVLSWGSDRVFVRPSRIQPELNDDGTLPYHAMETYTLKDQLFFSATAGVMYLDTDSGIIIAGQYYFNGEGYGHHFFSDGTSWLDAAAHLIQNPQDNGLSVPQGQQPVGYEDPPGLGPGDLMNWGQHYLGLSFIWNEIGDSSISAGVFWILNMTDGSGVIFPTVTFAFTDYIKLRVGVRMTHGWPGGEYTDTVALFLQNPDRNTQEPIFSLNFELSFGGGSF